MFYNYFSIQRELFINIYNVAKYILKSRPGLWTVSAEAPTKIFTTDYPAFIIKGISGNYFLSYDFLIWKRADDENRIIY